MSIIEKALGKQREDGATTEEGSAVAARSADGTGRSVPAFNRSRAGDLAKSRIEPVAIDLQYLRQRGVWPPASMEHQLRDQYRRIKRPLLENATGQGLGVVERGNLIGVTSSLSGEGKTFTSLNLAFSVAQDPDFEVLVVDGDVVRRSLSGLLQIEKRPGLMDLLVDHSLNPEDVVLPTTVASLSVLPAGRSHALGSELLSSVRMEALTNWLSSPSSGRVVIFDSPPLLVSPEAVSLAGLVGQIVLVVKAGATDQHAVLAALEQVDQRKPINMVLNQSKRSHGGDYYGGYYGYYGE